MLKMIVCLEQYPSVVFLTVKSGKCIGVAELESDGYYYLSIGQHDTGIYCAYTLRLIADALDAINLEWEREIDRYFENERKTK